MAECSAGEEVGERGGKAVNKLSEVLSPSPPPIAMEVYSDLGRL
jgi:hypothetical protein